MIIKKKIVSSEIDFLNDDSCLYSSDFRTISENADYFIPAMRKYENLIPWILKDKLAIVNPNAKKLKYNKNNNLLIIKNSKDPRISIYQRLSKTYSTKKFKKMWVAIPNTAADQYCRVNKLKINYSYDDFLIRNNKFIQKEILKNFTPEWKKIKSKEDLESLKNNKQNGYIKRSHGSGGYTVFKINKLGNEFHLLYEKDPDSWFFEEEASGQSCSIQCIKDDKGAVTIFGLSEQIIEQGRYYTGSRILNIDSIKENIYAQLKYGLKLLDKALKGYVGFFGVDFIITKDEKVLILEANIRLTAATIPTLLFNETNSDEALFKEDIKLTDISESDIIITIGDKNTGDVLTLMSNHITDEA